MKNKYLLFVSLMLISFGVMLSQEGTTELNSQKAKFVKDQGYLSKSSLKDYENYYGDSLKGFNEEYFRAIYLEKGLEGREFQFAMNRERRNFLDKKYKLSPPIPQVDITPSGVGNKPIGSGNSVNVFPCINEGFESTPPGVYNTATAVTGWTVESSNNNIGWGGISCTPQPPIMWNQGSPEFSIIATPVLGVPFIGNLPNSPLGGNNVARLQDTQISNGPMTRISTQFPVTNANTLFQFAFAGSWDGAHQCCEQASLRVDLYNCTGSLVLLPCANLTLTPSSSQCIGTSGYSTTGNVSWTNWQVKYIDLTPYIGQCIKLVVTTSDCTYSGHHGSLWFDAQCGGQLIGQGLGGVGGNVPGAVSFCAGSNQAVIAAPIGYVSYQWVAPGGFPIPAPAGTGPTYTVTSPVPGSVWTLQATSQSGCQYVITNTINFTQVNFAGVGVGPSCIGGASGTATVQGNGSGTGYNYNWLNTNSVTVGTASIATGLAPGIYSIVLTGQGAAGCGSAVTTVSIGTAPSTLINVYKPYCNNEAYLCAQPGSNFKWYNNTTLIAPPAGIQQCYTVTAPVNGGIYHLSYLSAQGCQDTVKYTLGLSAPGIMTPTNIPLICPGGSNGSAQIRLIPALGSPPGQNSYSVFSIGSTTPAFSASAAATASTLFPVSGLTAGTYSVNAFDGSCKYGGSFNVVALTYNYTLSPTATSLCPGNAVAAGITFSVPPTATQYSYSWTPNVWLAGNNAALMQTIISPTVAPGTVSNVIYTVVVTPSVANCPLTKTLSITAINPAPPIITPIPAMCNNSTAYSVAVSPVGGTFAAVNPTLLNTITGVLSPSFVPSFGTHTMSYAYSIFTCVATSTANFQVSQFNTAALTASVPNLCVTNPPVNLMNIVQSTVNGTWSTATPNAIMNNILYPAGLNTGQYQLQYVTTSFPNPTVCPAVTNLNVSITKTTTPYITPKSPFCNNAQAFTMSVTPAGGTWSGNGVTQGGIVTPTAYINQGLYNLTYTVADGPCINSAATLLDVSRFVSANIQLPIPYQCVSNNPFNLMGIVQNTTGSWVGSGVVNGISLNPAQVPASGFYTYTYTTPSVPNAQLCPDTQTITTHILNPPSASITPVGPLCNNGSALQLTVSPMTGSWTPSPFLSNSGQFTPSLCPVGNNIVQYVIGTNTCNTVQNLGISIEAFVSAQLNSPVPDQCNTNSLFNLNNVTLNDEGSWVGPGVNGSNFNPAAVGSGVFILQYNTVSSPSGLCPDQSTVAVAVYSLAPPAVTQIGPFCSVAEPKQIQVIPAGGVFGGANNQAVSPQGIFNPGSAVFGYNIVNYSVTSGPCVAYAQTTINVEEYKSADFARYVDPMCRNANPINLNSYVLNPGGLWAGTGMSGSMFMPNLANSGINNVISYSVYSSPLKLCLDTSIINIQVNDLPNVSVTTNKAQGCAPLEILLGTGSSNVGNMTWNMGDGSETQQGLNTSYVFNNPGSYTVTYAFRDEIGCESFGQLKDIITVFDVPVADFSAPAEVLISNPVVQITNLSSDLHNNTYSWKVDEKAVYTNALNPVVTLDKIGRHSISLQAVNKDNCRSETLRYVEVKNDFNIYIPSSFTPNFDGLNDVFKPVFSPYGLDEKTYELEVFDRWGHTLFYSKDVNKGWDGTVLNKGSEELKEEVYIYRIKYKDMEGNVYNKMGHVTLLR